MIRRALFWLAFNVPLGNLTPWVIGLAIGRKPVRMVWSEGKWRMPSEPSNAIVDEGMEEGK